MHICKSWQYNWDCSTLFLQITSTNITENGSAERSFEHNAPEGGKHFSGLQSVLLICLLHQEIKSHPKHHPNLS
jgi:hypothetical protein